MMNETIVSGCITILKTVIMYWDNGLQSTDTIQNYIVILSNLLEYIEYDQMTVNVTNTWSKYPTKNATIYENMNGILSIVQWMRNNSLYQINTQDTLYSYTSRMIAIKQSYTSTSSSTKFSATNNTKSTKTTYIQVA